MDWINLSLTEAKWVCVDVETTGLEVEQGHRVCEIGLVKGGGEEEITEFESLVDPGRPIPPEATAVSGLADADVAEAPAFAELAPRVLDLLAGAVLVAHNAPFDVGFLETELDREGRSLPAAPIVDTTVIAQTVLGLPVRNLSGVAQLLQLARRPKHRAVDDARATRGVLLAGLEALQARGATTVGEVMEALMPAGSPDRSLMEDPLLAVREALQRGLDVRATYEGAQGVTERVVRPIRLELKGRDLLLSAYCRTRRAPRSFRAGRIARAEIAFP